jgi:hypothetical protein
LPGNFPLCHPDDNISAKKHGIFFREYISFKCKSKAEQHGGAKIDERKNPFLKRKKKTDKTPHASQQG